MKKIVKMVVGVAVIIVVILYLSSCVRFVPVGQVLAVRPYFQNPQGFQEQTQQRQRGERHLNTVNVVKIDIGRIGVRTKNATPAQRAEVKAFVIGFYNQSNRTEVPTNQALSEKYGFPVECSGFEDTPDRVVGTIKVRPEEVPENIRARFK